MSGIAMVAFQPRTRWALAKCATGAEIIELGNLQITSTGMPNPSHSDTKTNASAF
jgi:hypothetical protein